MELWDILHVLYIIMMLVFLYLLREFMFENMCDYRNCFWFCLFVCFARLHLQHMEIPRLGAKSELQLLVYTTATATQDP